ncbi:MAG: TonB-dependent receptor [Pseudomonadota bacterium]|nr:TonB-dependent receptor [Pseudomonadota bacterium]
MGQFSPMVGLVFKPAPLTRYYAHAAPAVQTPTTSELGNRPEGAGGFNPELEPERILGVEVGLRHRSGIERTDQEQKADASHHAAFFSSRSAPSSASKLGRTCSGTACRPTSTHRVVACW